MKDKNSHIVIYLYSHLNNNNSDRLVFMMCNVHVTSLRYNYINN